MTRSLALAVLACLFVLALAPARKAGFGGASAEICPAPQSCK